MPFYATAAAETVANNPSLSFPMVITIALAVLLIARELITGLPDVRVRRVGWAINATIVPLLILFVGTVVVRAVDIVGAFK